MTGENIEEAKTAKKTRMQRFKESTRGALKFSFIFFSAVHVATIVVASIHMKNCPVQTEIPPYLLTLGILGILSRLITLFSDFIIRYVRISPFLSFITTTELGVLIVGSYYVYRVYEPDYDPDSGDNYCNKTVYLFSFVYMTIIYAIILLFVGGVSCFVVGIVLLDKYVKEEPVDDVESTAVVAETEQAPKEGNY